MVSEELHDTGEYSETDNELGNEDSISFMSLIKNGKIGISEIIKIILLFVAIILLSLGAYILVKIK